MEYGFKVIGCDVTYFNMELTEEEFKLVEQIALKSKEAYSLGGCGGAYLEVGEKIND